MSIRRPFLIPILLVVLLGLGCAGRAWRAAQTEDSAAAYHRYIREHPDSKHVAEAKARLAFVRVRSKPTAAAFEEFAEKFAGSPLVDELRPLVEEPFFEQARARGTAEGYRAFLADFPDGRNAACASR